MYICIYNNLQKDNEGQGVGREREGIGSMAHVTIEAGKILKESRQSGDPGELIFQFEYLWEVQPLYSIQAFR